MRRLAACLALLVLHLACGPVPHPQPIPQPDRTAEFTATCSALWQQELERPIDPGGLEGCINQAKAGRTADDIRAWLKTTSEYIALHSFHPLLTITVDGTIFRENGTPWVWKGVTAFQIMDRWTKGENVQPFLDAYRGYNTLVVFLYVEPQVWGAAAWDAPAPGRVVDFVHYAATKGWRVELVLLTSSPVAFPNRLSQARDTLAALNAARPTNVFIRLGNEPAEQNGAGNPTFDTHVLKDQADASGFLYDSGFYEANGSTWFSAPSKGYLSVHSKRDPAEWVRRAHDCFDITHGAADAPQLGKKPVPCLMGEPPKPQDVGMTEADAMAYAATSVQFGSGGTFHSSTGIRAQTPTASEAALARAFLAGLNAFPGDTNRGAYRRIDGDGLRTYVVGSTMVRIRPNGPTNPESGWTSLDADHILWRR